MLTYKCMLLLLVLMNTITLTDRKSSGMGDRIYVLLFIIFNVVSCRLLAVICCYYCRSSKIETFVDVVLVGERRSVDIIYHINRGTTSC